VRATDTYLHTHQTDRLTIVPLTDTHISGWIRFLQNAESTRFFPEYLHTFAEREAEIWIKRQQQRYQDGAFGLLALHLKDGTFIGQCGLLTQEADGETILEIGYHLFAEFQGNGYATEAATYFKHYARQLAISPFVVSMIHRDNTLSQAVARRNGMSPWKSLEWRKMPIVIYRTEIQP
jgi:RimJ/RimL family protein N-acetyltransferase